MHLNMIVNLLAAVALSVMMVDVGISVTIGDVLNVVTDWRLLLRAGAANYLFVPAAAVGLLLLFHPTPMVAVGFLIAVVCPGAPFAPRFTAIAKGKVTTAVGLMVVLAGSSAIVAPLLLRFLLPLVAGQNTAVQPVKIVTTLMLSQFLPLCLGLGLRRLKPGLAEQLKMPCSRLGTLLNLVLISLILVVQFEMLKQIRISGYAGMLAMVGATLMGGWLLGGLGEEQRKTMAITTSARNIGVALVIAASSFPGTPAVTSATAYALFQTLTVLLIAIFLGRSSASTPTSIKLAS